MRVQEIADADDLHRRIHPSQVKAGKPTSAAFEDPQLSVDLARLTTPPCLNHGPPRQISEARSSSQPTGGQPGPCPSDRQQEP
jgi:hypothetical protein